MKKIIIAAFTAVVAMAFTACGEKAPKANLDSDIDSLSYAIGMLQSQGLSDYLKQQFDIDSTYSDEFIKGVIEGANAGDNKKQAAYYAGIQIGQQISNQMVKGINYQVFGEDSTKTISMKNFLSGFLCGYKGKTGSIDPEKAQALVEATFQKLQQARQEEQAKKMEEQFGENKKAGEKFLAENKTKEGVITLPSGVQYKIVKAGTGAKPTASDRVKVKYEGKLIDGTVFDSTAKHGGEPAEFPVGGVIPGWTEALQLMPVGSVWEVYIPQDKAYGAADRDPIKPFSALIFTVELLEIVK